MRKRRTSAEARLIVTLSFSAHATGSLAFVTSTARSAAEAAKGKASASRTTARRIAVRSSHALILEARAEGEPRRTHSADAASTGCVLRGSSLRSSHLSMRRYCVRQLGVQHGIHIPRIGFMGKGDEVRRHLLARKPASEGQSLRLTECDVEAVGAERGQAGDAALRCLAADGRELEGERRDGPGEPHEHAILEALDIDLRKNWPAVVVNEAVEGQARHGDGAVPDLALPPRRS